MRDPAKIHRILDVQQQLHRIEEWRLADLDRTLRELAASERESDPRAQRGRRAAGPLHRRHGAAPDVDRRGSRPRRRGEDGPGAAAAGARGPQGLRRAAGASRSTARSRRPPTSATCSTPSSASSRPPHKPPARLPGHSRQPGLDPGIHLSACSDAHPWPSLLPPISSSAWRWPRSPTSTAPRSRSCSA